MPYPFDNIPTGTLTQIQSIDAIAEAEAGILSSMSELLYKPEDPTSTPKKLYPKSDTLLGEIYKLLVYADTTGGPLVIHPMTTEIASLIKQILLSYACKEESIAEVINSLACKLGLVNGVFTANEENGCCFIRR